MTIFQLDCFLAVADYLNFAKAAEQMNISQPAVTHQIQSLENELGIKLFRRTTRQVELTTEGLVFLEDAKSISGISKRALMRFRNKDEQEILDFSVGCASWSQMELLPDVLRHLAAHYPGLHPKLTTASDILLLSQVSEGSMDAALGIQNPDPPKKPLQYKELFKVSFFCVYSGFDSLDGRTSLYMEDVKTYPLILLRPGSASSEITGLQLRLAESKKPSELFLCETPEAAVLLARAGIGLAVLPEIYIPPQRGIRKYILSDAPVLSYGIHYRSLTENPVLKDFLQILKTTFADSGMY